MCDWYPDWRGETCILVAAGPSAKTTDYARFRGRARFVAINRSHELVPWADILYACDGRFWRNYPEAHAFAGLKVTQDEGAAVEFPYLMHVRLKKEAGDKPLMDYVAERGSIGGGGNSTFQAANMVAQFGVAGIILTACEMHLRSGSHWHGRHPNGMANPSPGCMQQWISAFQKAATRFADAGIRVFNATPDSDLKVFPFLPLDEAIEACAAS